MTEPGNYHCRLVQGGKGEPNIPENVELEYDDVAHMEPVSTKIVKIRIKSIEKGPPYIF